MHGMLVHMVHAAEPFEGQLNSKGNPTPNTGARHAGVCGLQPDRRRQVGHLHPHAHDCVQEAWQEVKPVRGKARLPRNSSATFCPRVCRCWPLPQSHEGGGGWVVDGGVAALSDGAGEGSWEGSGMLILNQVRGVFGATLPGD